jgi:hypothetical protein
MKPGWLEISASKARPWTFDDESGCWYRRTYWAKISSVFFVLD